MDLGIYFQTTPFSLIFGPHPLACARLVLGESMGTGFVVLGGLDEHDYIVAYSKPQKR